MNQDFIAMMRFALAGSIWPRSYSRSDAAALLIMRTASIMTCTWRALFSAGLGMLMMLPLFLSQQALAAAPDVYTYCWAGNCYPDMGQAEAALRSDASTPASQLMEPVHSSVRSDGTVDVRYRAPAQPAEVWGDIAYMTNLAMTYTCQRASSPRTTNTGCINEQDAIDMTIAELSRLNGQGGCYATNFTMTGSWVEPYETIDDYPPGQEGMVNYTGAGRKLVYDYTCPQFYEQREVGFRKVQDFKCKDGFWFGRGGNGKGMAERWANGKKLCGSDETRNITTRLTQSSTCPANKFPCYPATGDKARFEGDFRFAGRSIERVYHSSMQAVSPMLPRGWRYSFEERIVYASDNSSFYFHIDERGNYAAYRFDNKDDAVATETSGSGRTLQRTPYGLDQDVFMFDLNGDVRTFDRYGYLQSIVNPSDPSRNLYLTYVRSGIYNDGKVLQLRDVAGRTIDFAYDLQGRASVISVPGVSDIEISYDTRGDLTGVEIDGNQRIYHYESEPGLLTGITDETGSRYATFAYDARRRVLSSQLHDNGTAVEKTLLNYVSDDQVEVTTAGGEVRTYQMSGQTFRQIQTITDSRGTESRLYGSYGLVFRSTNAGGQVTEYNPGETQFAISDGVGSSQERRREYGLDGRSRVLRNTTWNKVGANFQRHLQSTFSYDVDGRRISACRHDIDLPAALSYQCGSVQDAPVGVRQTRIEYCTSNDVASSSFGCALEGQVKAIHGPRTDVLDTTSYAYYSTAAAACVGTLSGCGYRPGDLWKVTDALGRSIEVLAYDAAGRPLAVKDVNGVVTETLYYPRGWVAALTIKGATSTDDRTTLYDYWPTGLVKKITDPNGVYTSYEYDDAQRLMAIADSAGNRIEYALDAAGNRVGENTKDVGGALKRTLSRIYNTLGQLATRADAQANPTDFTYDASGNNKTVTDALGHVTSNDYDPLNRLKRTLQDMGGIEAETKFEYDANDNLTKVTDPKGLDTNYIYNGFGDQMQVSSPDTGITTYTYDSAGNRASQADARGITTTYHYDALDRLIQVGYPTTSLNVSYTYDVTQPVCRVGETFSVGRLTLMVDGGGSTQYCHDRFGQLVRKVQTAKGITLALQYAYTKSGQLQAITYPDGAVADYARNAQGQVTTVGVTRPGQTREILLQQAAYHPFGPIAGWVYGNGRVMRRDVDLDHRPTLIQGGAGGLDLTYRYDAVGNLTHLDGGTPPAVEYHYDALGRLTEALDSPAQAVLDKYAYDKTGNRTSYTDSFGARTYTYPINNHRLSSVAGESRSYDAIGNTVSIGVAREFDYNDAGRVSQVRNGGVVAMQYAYSGHGQQVRRYSGTSIRHSLYAEDGRWLGEYGDTSAALQQVIWLDDLPVGLIDGAGTAQRLLYIEPDHLGSPRAVIDPVRNRAVWKWDIKGEAFGSSAPNEDPDRDGTRFVFDMRFPGQRYDSATGLHYNYYRDGYDAAIGRYTQSDPIGLAGGINTYLYTLGSPLLRVDPMGLQAIPLPVRPPLPIVPPHGGKFSDEADPDGYSGGNVIPFPRSKSNDACPPDNDCVKRKTVLMAQHFSIDAKTALEYARGVHDSELIFRKLLWNRAASEWNATCGPLGYPIIESVWFYELGPRKL